MWWKKDIAVGCQFQKSRWEIGDVAVMECFQQLHKILIFKTFLRLIWEISQVVYKKTLLGVCCMKRARAFITTACWLHRIASSFVGVLHDSFLANDFADFRDVVKNQDFVQSLVGFFTATSAIHFMELEICHIDLLNSRFCTWSSNQKLALGTEPEMNFGIFVLDWLKQACKILDIHVLIIFCQHWNVVKKRYWRTNTISL